MKAIARLSICLLILTISFGAPSALAVNKVLSLDGYEDFVEIVDSPTLNSLESQITIEAWIRADGYSGEWMSIIYKGDSIEPEWANRSFAFWLNRSGRYIHFTSAPSGSAQMWLNSPNDSIRLDTWYHVSGIIDSVNHSMKLLINGNEVASLDYYGDSIRTSTLPLGMGHSQEGYPNFSGILDEVRIWNIARTQEEIRANMNQPIENPESLTNLIGYWNFDDDTADDLSQYGNNGTLQGDATIAQVISVPDDYPTIQAGIDAANSGDVVDVDAGTYNENVVISKDRIRLKGSGADVTAIDGGGAGSVVKMSGVSNVTISGFTIRNGLGDGQDYYFNDNGGGIAVYECSNITIRNNVITQNNATGGHADGGGILICKSTGYVTIWQNSITDNHAQHWGGGISIQGTFDVRIDDNDISNNDAGVGDGVSLWEGDPVDGASARIINNEITNNQGDGIHLNGACSALIGGNRDNANDIFGNTEYAVRNDSTDPIDATYNYWGTTVEIEIQDVIYDYYDGATDIVNYEPWIDETHVKVFPFAQALNLPQIGNPSYVEITASSSLNGDIFRSPFTITAWIHPTFIGDEWQQIWRSLSPNDAGDTLFVNVDGRLSWRGRLGGGWNVLCETSPGVVTSNRWTHVAVVGDGNSFTIFVNAAKQAEETFELTDGGLSVFYIGNDARWTNEKYQGLIDEVRIWNVARTREEIQDKMNTTLQGNESGLVGYWNFDDGTANDSTLNANHGTLQGDAEIVPLYGNWPPPKIGDVSGDGTISAYDASLILQYVVGLIDRFPVESMSSPSTIEPHDYELSLPAVQTSVGKKIQVPIVINDVAGLSAGGITLKYDPAVLRAVGYGSLELLNGYYWKANTDLSGEVRFAFATMEPAKGQGNLLMVEFEVLPNTEGRTSPLIFDNVDLSNSLSIKKNNGEVRVIPSAFALLQNYPNPFNPETWLPYKLANDTPVTVSIYNSQGQIVQLIDLGIQRPGVYLSKDKAAYWNGRNSMGEKVASGVYFYTLQAGKFTATRRMLIIK